MRGHQRTKPLYRKVNTRARGVQHDFGGEYRHRRNSATEKGSESPRSSMGKRRKRGLDYTPLYRFLLSKVGQEWDAIYSEAVARLDRPEPIFQLVARFEHERQEYVRTGESSYFSGMYIDAANRLQLVNPELDAAQMTPSCQCCTHTLNGVPFGGGGES